MVLFGASLSPALKIAASTPIEDMGRQLFAAQCAHCHGADGAGGDEYPDPLQGDLSVSQLADLIHQTMPADNPESLSAAEAQSVARYIHGAFYSAIARSRGKPPEIQLARLTVRQEQRALADLIGSFRSPLVWNGGTGLKGKYYVGRSLGDEKQLAVERVDKTIDFDFSANPPTDEISDDKPFSARWTGSVYAADTGWYRFVIHTKSAVRLWINNGSWRSDQATIDAWVTSTTESDEPQAKVYLLGGRAYPLRLEFSSGNQGVRDEKQHEKNKEPQWGLLELVWEPPLGVPEPIPTRFLSSQANPESFVCTTPFPPDDRSYGWERGTSVSQGWYNAVTHAAIEAANYIDNHCADLSGADGNALQSDKLKSFAETLAERAFRQPLTSSLQKKYVELQFETVEDPKLALRRAVLMILTSPRFLFREIVPGTPSYDVASRLAFILWDSQPDEILRQAAASGELATPEQVRTQAQRMLADIRAHSKLRQFLLSWLEVDSQVDLTKDHERFPEFDAQTIADLRTSLDVFLDEVVWSEGSDYRRLFLADEVFLNRRLARFYGNSQSAEQTDSDHEFAKAQLDNGRRAGVLTHPYMLARFAHSRETSPIHRGVFLVRKVLGQTLKPPPQAVAPLPAQLHPELTTRERVTLQTKPANCMTCHHLINPLGFTLERFDAVGRYREREDDKKIDDVGYYQPRDGNKVTLAGARELAKFLASSEEVSDAFVEQLFHFLVQQSIQAYGPDVARRLQEQFVEQDYNIQKLVIEIAVAASPVGRSESGVEPEH